MVWFGLAAKVLFGLVWLRKTRLCVVWFGCESLVWFGCVRRDCVSGLGGAPVQEPAQLGSGRRCAAGGTTAAGQMLLFF